MMTKVKFSAIPLIAAIVVVAALMNGGGSNDGSFRLATATTRSVTKTLDEVGTVEPVSAASVAFPTAGTVASVAATVGQTVSRGQTLASLDPASLQRAINSAQAALDQAKLTLANARAGVSNSDNSNSNNSRVSAQATEPESDPLQQAQDAVVAAQSDVDKQIADAQAALASATDLCAAIPQDGSDTTAAVAACQSALSDVMAAQTAVSDAQTDLSNASNAFDALVAQKAAELTAQSSSNNAPTGNSNNSPSNGNSSTTASAADLAADQAAVDAATAALAVANHNLIAATIVSPIDGTIEAVNLAVGDAVTAGSTTSVIRVVGTGGYEVTAIVGVAKLADIKLGQQAAVTPDGSNKSLTGEVVAIGAPRTSNGATSYPVSIGLDDDSALHNGTTASVTITTASATSSVAVPTSAVHVETNRAFVYVVDSGKTKAVDVTVGVIGKTWTQIKSGLEAGQAVVLADLGQALPGSATSSNNSNSGNGNRNNVPVIFGGPPGASVQISPKG